MHTRIEIDEGMIKQLVKEYLEAKLNATIDFEYLKIEVKSKFNYKSEWEPAAFRAVYEKYGAL